MTETKSKTPADKYRDMLVEELYFMDDLDYLISGFGNMTLGEAKALLSQELCRVRK